MMSWRYIKMSTMSRPQKWQQIHSLKMLKPTFSTIYFSKHACRGIHTVTVNNSTWSQSVTAMFQGKNCWVTTRVPKCLRSKILYLISYFFQKRAQPLLSSERTNVSGSANPVFSINQWPTLIKETEKNWYIHFWVPAWCLHFLEFFFTQQSSYNNYSFSKRNVFFLH
jgi:hypothetical protein